VKTSDVSVLLHVVNGDSPQHLPTGEWLEATFTTPSGVGFSWVTMLGFIWLAINPAVSPTRLVEDAPGLVNDWLNHPDTRVPSPTDHHSAPLAQPLLGARQASNLATEVHLATIAIKHGTTLDTLGRDFERFSGAHLELPPAHAVHEP
jgi:predicted nucleic acid-binding protein